MPKFILLIYEDERATPHPPSPEWQELWDAYVRLDEEARAAGVLLDSQPFAPAATAVTLSRDGSRTVETPGPAHTAELQLTGYYLVSCAGFAEAVGWARKIPALREGRVEVRRILDGPEDA